MINGKHIFNESLLVTISFRNAKVQQIYDIGKYLEVYLYNFVKIV